MKLVRVLLDGKSNMMPRRHIDSDRLQGLIDAAGAGTLRFLSFDEHPKRVLSISQATANGEATISVRSLAPQDGFPENWEPLFEPIAKDWQQFAADKSGASVSNQKAIKQ